MNKLNLFFAASMVSLFLLAACGSKAEVPGVPEAPAESEYVSALQPLNNPDLLTLPAADGRTACGVFDLATGNPPTGWGLKTAALASWPACASHSPNLEVLCLNGDAQWVSPTIDDLTVSADGSQLSWTSQQDGICGLFATN